MYAIFDLFLDICLFRKGPQHVPHSATLLTICLLGYALSGLWLLALNLPLPLAVLQVFLDLLLLSGLLYLALVVQHQRQRFAQTLCALTGSGALMTLLAIPLMAWIAHQAPAAALELPALLLLGLMLWSIALLAHILRHAFSTSLWYGLLYAVGYTLVSWVLTGWIGVEPA